MTLSILYDSGHGDLPHIIPTSPRNEEKAGENAKKRDFLEDFQKKVLILLFECELRILLTIK